MDESRIIIDWNEQGDGSYDIRVVGYSNFKQHFSEAFYSIERPMSVLSVSDSSISSEVACNSATITLLKHLLNIIGNGVKTKGHIFTEKELNLKFPFVDLIAIERFEQITGLRFDHSKFNNLKESFKSILLNGLNPNVNNLIFIIKRSEVSRISKKIYTFASSFGTMFGNNRECASFLVKIRQIKNKEYTRHGAAHIRGLPTVRVFRCLAIPTRMQGGSPRSFY